jgi:DNA-binding GntR family transcriptional regulator
VLPFALRAESSSDRGCLPEGTAGVGPAACREGGSVGRPRGDDILDAVLGAPHDGRTMAEAVAQRLKMLIVDGQLPPGTPLRLSQLSERLGVSVMPVREALRLLEAERFVRIAPRRGAVVTELSVEDAEETYAVRIALEALAARRAAEKLTDQDVAELRDAFDQLAAAQGSGNLHAFIEADHVFHSRLYQASGRERLIRNISELVDRSRRYAPYAYRAWQPLDTALAAHRPIFEAILARDAALVERLTSEHMSAAATRLVTLIQREADERARAQAPRRRRRVARGPSDGHA